VRTEKNRGDKNQRLGRFRDPMFRHHGAGGRAGGRDLEGAHEGVVDAHHGARVVELAAVVGRREEGHLRAGGGGAAMGVGRGGAPGRIGMRIGWGARTAFVRKADNNHNRRDYCYCYCFVIVML
jgi:hypothetical protein